MRSSSRLNGFWSQLQSRRRRHINNKGADTAACFDQTRRLQSQQRFSHHAATESFATGNFQFRRQFFSPLENPIANVLRQTGNQFFS